MNIGAILEVVPCVKSRDQIGKAGCKTLLQYFHNQFGESESFEFKAAQWAFARSLAGYAVVCYILRIKDRHNGNILIDQHGHVIHIDYGFILGISPGTCGH
jgi:phosphatidylinositol 4-kinase